MTNPSTPTQQEQCPTCGSDDPECDGYPPGVPHGPQPDLPPCPDPFHSEPPSPNPSEPERCGGKGKFSRCNCRPAMDGGGVYHDTDCPAYLKETAWRPCPGCPDCNPSEPIHGAGQEGPWTIYVCPTCGMQRAVAGECEGFDSEWMDPKYARFEQHSATQVVEVEVGRAPLADTAAHPVPLLSWERVHATEALLTQRDTELSTLRGEVERVAGELEARADLAADAGKSEKATALRHAASLIRTLSSEEGE